MSSAGGENQRSVLDPGQGGCVVDLEAAVGDWSDDDPFEIEPALRAVLAGAAIGAFTKAPSVLPDHYDRSGGAVDRFTQAGSGDLDRLPGHASTSELSYHLHGPPSIGESFETSTVFRTLLFDWEQVHGDDASWWGGGFEVVAAFPFAKAGKIAHRVDGAIDAARAIDRVDDALDLAATLDRTDTVSDLATTLDRADDALDAARAVDLVDDSLDVEQWLPGGLLAHERTPERVGGHTIEKHVGRTEEQLRERMRVDRLRAVSTFDDLASAELGIARVIAGNQATVGSWLSSTGYDWTMTFDTGVFAGSVIRNGQLTVERSSRVFVKLVRDPSLSTGYRVQTAFLE